jgi:uncharacterized protein (TIGR04141 family)
MRSIRREMEGIDERAIRSIDGKLFIGRVNAKEPKWFSFVRDSVKGKLPSHVKNSTVSGVLFFKTTGRWCAATFGLGR